MNLIWQEFEIVYYITYKRIDHTFSIEELRVLSNDTFLFEGKCQNVALPVDLEISFM